MDLSVALERIIMLLNDLTFVPFAAGFVLVVTQLLKSTLKLEGGRAALVALVIQAGVWAAYAFFKARGMEANFEQWVTAAETIITSLVSVLFPAILAGLATQGIYERVAAKKVPGFRGKAA